LRIKKKQEYLEQLPDKYLNEILEYLQSLQFKNRNENADVSSMLLSENSLAKEWLTPEEDKAWEHL
jgi:predicted house-cleaning noncanonical NTP pyrophosphatase (MazG superfamily)